MSNKLDDIQVVHGSDIGPASVASAGEDAPELSIEEDWNLHLNALKQQNRAKDWASCLKTLHYLANKDGHDDVYKAMGQAAWMAIKVEAPIDEVTMILYNVIVSLGARHGAAPAIAALANLMVTHREDGSNDWELAQAHAQQMLQFVSPDTPFKDQEEFSAWVHENRLDDPDYFVPIALEAIDGLVRGDWWIDREAIQAEMEEANQKAMEEANKAN